MKDAERLLEAMKEKGLTLGSVESLTAGLFGSSICSIAGASAVYKGGIITYASELKTKLVGVPASLIEEKGVVSEEVALAMAKGGLEKINSSIAVSFTGNAGPTAEKGGAPVGMVWMSIASKGLGEKTFCEIFKGDRNEVRTACIDRMVKELLEFIS